MDKIIGRVKTLSTEEYNELLFSDLTEEKQAELLNKLADHSVDISFQGKVWIPLSLRIIRSMVLRMPQIRITL